MTTILLLDKSGHPARWASVEEAALCVAKDLIVWTLGEDEFVLSGGINRTTGERSSITLKPIMAVHSDKDFVRHFKHTPTVNRRMLFTRDMHMCAYCGQVHHHGNLTMDHIVPSSKGGADTWTNLVTACKPCNSFKDNKSLKQAGLELLYVPYVPNRWESFILANRTILQDQMDFLLGGVSKHFRKAA